MYFALGGSYLMRTEFEHAPIFFILILGPCLRLTETLGFKNCTDTIGMVANLNLWFSSKFETSRFLAIHEILND